MLKKMAAHMIVQIKLQPWYTGGLRKKHLFKTETNTVLSTTVANCPTTMERDISH